MLVSVDNKGTSTDERVEPGGQCSGKGVKVCGRVGIGVGQCVWKGRDRGGTVCVEG